MYKIGLPQGRQHGHQYHKFQEQVFGNLLHEQRRDLFRRAPKEFDTEEAEEGVVLVVAKVTTVVARVARVEGLARS